MNIEIFKYFQWSWRTTVEIKGFWEHCDFILLLSTSNLCTGHFIELRRNLWTNRSYHRSSGIFNNAWKKKKSKWILISKSFIYSKNTKIFININKTSKRQYTNQSSFHIYFSHLHLLLNNVSHSSILLTENTWIEITIKSSFFFGKK